MINIPGFLNFYKRFLKTNLKLDDLKKDEGDIVEIEGKKVAAYRDKDNNVHMCSPICTHLGCQVEWNKNDKSWDCPCHGARFTPVGDVIKGPATKPLEKIK